MSSYNYLSYSYVLLILYDCCQSSDHDVHNCNYHDYVDATCASLRKTTNELADKMIETMKKRIVEYSYFLI